MPRNSDIEIAWRQAIVIEPNGRRTVTTSGFIRELAKVNWIWSPRQANQWIERNPFHGVKSCKPKRPLEPVNASRFFTILSDSISQSALIQYYRLKWQGWDNPGN